MWEKTPTTRQEKISLQRRNRLISGFTIEKGWNEKTLYNRVKAQLPEDCNGIEFEFVNVSPSLYLFRPSDCRLNIRNLVRLLHPKFAEEGSNLKRYQKVSLF